MRISKSIDFPYTSRKFIKTSELLDKNLSYYKIRQLEKQNIIRRINGDSFENLTYHGEDHEFLYVSGYVAQGVVCLMSAAVYHDMSTFRSNHIDVAIRHKSKVSVLPDWPRIKIFYFSDKRYDIGIQTISCEGGFFRVYDPEKTVCDLLVYRYKYGLEDALHVLKNYLGREDRDINKLIRYAEMMRCHRILSTYLEVLL